MTLETLVAIATLVGVLGTLASVIVAAYQLRSGLRYRRQKDTLDFYEQIQADIRNAQRVLSNRYREECLSDEQVREIFADEEIKFKFHALLNVHERLALGVNSGIYDLAMLNRLAGGLFLRAWEKYRPYIDFYCDQMKRTTPWSEFRILAASLRAFRENSTGA